jgi:hypothetical protein
VLLRPGTTEKEPQNKATERDKYEGTEGIVKGKQERFLINQAT